jgi:hypothetical protein
MANIFVTDLQPLGSGLFSDSESFIDSMQDLSENEIKMLVANTANLQRAVSLQRVASLQRVVVAAVVAAAVATIARAIRLWKTVRSDNSLLFLL